VRASRIHDEATSVWNGRLPEMRTNRAELADRPSEREARAGEEGRRDARRTTRRTTPAGERAEGRRRLFGLASSSCEDGLDRTDGEGAASRKASASRIPAGVPATLTPKGLLGP